MLLIEDKHMKKIKGVSLTDGLNRKNHDFPLDLILNTYENSWKDAGPSYFNHDISKLIGWSYTIGIYIEPGKTYVLNEIAIPENDEENESLVKNGRAYLYSKCCEGRKEEYDVLKEMLSDKLTDQSIPASINCVAYYDMKIISKVFTKLDVDSDGLIDLRLLTPVLPGVYRKGKYLLFAHRYFRRNCCLLNSLNDEFLRRLQNLQNSNLNVKIALDLDMIGLAGSEREELEYQYWWGPKFNDDLSSIPDGITRHNNENYSSLSNICFTEFGWYEQDGRRTFECEEVVDIHNIECEDIEYCGCRFVHSMLNPTTCVPNHLDGAIRAYTDELMLERLGQNIAQSERNTKYTKLWRIDNDMPVDLWKELIAHYYRDNMLVGEYFNGEDGTLTMMVSEEDNDLDKRTHSNKYIPTNMNSNDGLRLLFHYEALYDMKKDLEVQIDSNAFCIMNGEKVRVIESETITIIKLIKSYGAKISMPEIARIGCEDMILNFPTFVCRNIKAAQVVQNAIAELCKIWAVKKNDRLISYSIAVNYDNEAVFVSFAGHVSDFAIIFEKIGTSFPGNSGLKKWIEDLYRENNKFSRSCSQRPDIFDIASNYGGLRFKRSLVPKKYQKAIVFEDKCLKVKCKGSKEMVEELQKNGIGMSPIFRINETLCSKCKEDYRLCTCIKYIDDMYEEIQKCELIDIAWANRFA